MPLVNQTELIRAALAGEVVSFPTDTVPALAVIPSQADLIFQLKQRPQNKPLILMAASEEELWRFVQGTPNELVIWQQMAHKYWSGALTLVLPASEQVPPGVNSTQSNSIGIRVPDFPIAQAILQATGVLATTSANLSGKPALETMAEISAAFPQVYVLKDVPGGIKQKIGHGLPSTVIQWTGDNWQILRKGIIDIVES